MCFERKAIGDEPKFILFDVYREDKEKSAPLCVFTDRIYTTLGDPWFHAIDPLRPDIGSLPSHLQEEAQRIKTIFESMFQDVIKVSTLTEKDEPTEEEIGKPVDNPFFYFDAERIKMWLPSPSNPYGPGSNDFAKIFRLIDTHHTGERLIEKFIEAAKKPDGPKTFGDFMWQIEKHQRKIDILTDKRLQRSNDVMIQTLLKLNVTPEAMYQSFHAREATFQKRYGSKTWEQLGTRDKVFLLQIFLRQLSIQRYDLQKSKWHPKLGLQALVDELKERGPLAVGGVLGKLSYDKPPIQAKLPLNGRQIYYYTDGNVTNDSYQAVLLVGAKVTEDNKGFIYYLDPLDAQECKEQRTFVARYSRFVSGLADLNGVMRNDAPDEVGYAVYKNIPK